MTTDRDDWDQHWSAYAESNAWNPAQQWRMDIVLSRLLATPMRPECLVDLGCGQGEFLRALADDPAWRNTALLGLEGSAVGARMATAYVPSADVRHCDLVSGEGLPAEWDGRASHAVCSEVLEHVDNPFEVLRNALRILSPGGTLVVTVPGGPRSAYDRHIGHREHFTPQYLSGLLRGAGFSVQESAGVGWPFFNAYRLGIVLYGRRLIDDAPGMEAGSGTAGRVARVIGALLRRSTTRGRHGWQVVAVATRPEHHPRGAP